eukprot:6127063-Amphidinium_carterae.1
MFFVLSIGVGLPTLILRGNMLLVGDHGARVEYEKDQYHWQGQTPSESAVVREDLASETTPPTFK